MRLIQEVKLDGLTVTVRELLVADLRAMMREAEQAFAGEGEFDLIGHFLFDEVRLAELKAMTDLTDAQIDGLAPSELQKVIDACREVNQAFFGMRARLRPKPS